LIALKDNWRERRRMKRLALLVLSLALAGCGQQQPTKLDSHFDGMTVKWASVKGKTKDEIIKMFGDPVETTDGKSPDGPYQMLIYNRAKGHELFFIFFASDTNVFSAYCEGKQPSE
jgi:hypothetical protein